MGGLGSGNGGAARRVTYTDECLTLQVGNLGKIKPGSSGSVTWKHGNSLRLSYQQEGQAELSGVLSGSPWSQVISIDFTQTEGVASGRRAWFICSRCGGRCRSLYLRSSTQLFLCRTCQGLRYRSQSLGELDRAYRKESRIARRINPEAGATDFPRRPKGMQRRTYARLLSDWQEADHKRESIISWELVGVARRLGLI